VFEGARFGMSSKQNKNTHSTEYLKMVDVENIA